MAEKPGQENRDTPSRPSERSRSRLLGVAIAIAILLVVSLLVWVKPSDPTEKKDFIQAVGVLIAGLAGFMGLYFTWTNLNLTRQTTQRTLELTEQGQITERFTRAIDQLGATDDDGNPRLEVRLGGLYALERIDKESPERAYHSTVMEVLTAYVRENAPWPPRASESPDRPAKDSVSGAAPDETAKQDKGAVQDTEPTSRGPSTDILAIMDILKRREEDRVPEKHRINHLNLRESDLRGAPLMETRLEGADLYRANLEGADLLKAHLEGANFYQANLGGANLAYAHLEEARLNEAHLEGAGFLEANLERAVLYRTHLEKAILLSTRLEGASLYGANLEGANLTKAHLEGAIFNKANLEGAILSGANLEGAILSGANLEGVMVGSLTSEQIQLAIGNETTKLPEYLVDHRPSSWITSFGPDPFF